MSAYKSFICTGFNFNTKPLCDLLCNTLTPLVQQRVEECVWIFDGKGAVNVVVRTCIIHSITACMNLFVSNFAVGEYKAWMTGSWIPTGLFCGWRECFALVLVTMIMGVCRKQLLAPSVIIHHRTEPPRIYANNYLDGGQKARYTEIRCSYHSNGCIHPSEGPPAVKTEVSAASSHRRSIFFLLTDEFGWRLAIWIWVPKGIKMQTHRR